MSDTSPVVGFIIAFGVILSVTLIGGCVATHLYRRHRDGVPYKVAWQDFKSSTAASLGFSKTKNNIARDKSISGPMPHHQQVHTMAMDTVNNSTIQMINEKFTAQQHILATSDATTDVLDYSTNSRTAAAMQLRYQESRAVRSFMSKIVN